jgi:hypothetical protein
MLLSLAAPFRWTQPGTWPAFFYLWLAIAALIFSRPVWHWWRRQQASSWPVTQGRIDSTQVDEPKWYARSSNSANFGGVLNYSYSAGGQAFIGKYVRQFPSDVEAREFIRDMIGSALTIHYNPAKHSDSLAAESSIETLLQTRAPNPVAAALSKFNAIPSALVPLVWFFVALSAVGLGVSLFVHLGAVMGRRVVPDSFFFLLHAGAIAMFFPTVLVGRKRVGSTRRKDFWKLALRGSPDWMRYMVYGFFGYALVNFLLFMLNSPLTGKVGSPPAVVWRGFSGHWMAFYAASFAILYSAVSPDASGARCINGHTMPPGASFCNQCGQPALRLRA